MSNEPQGRTGPRVAAQARAATTLGLAALLLGALTGCVQDDPDNPNSVSGHHEEGKKAGAGDCLNLNAGFVMDCDERKAVWKSRGDYFVGYQPSGRGRLVQEIAAGGSPCQRFSDATGWFWYDNYTQLGEERSRFGIICMVRLKPAGPS